MTTPANCECFFCLEGKLLKEKSARLRASIQEYEEVLSVTIDGFTRDENFRLEAENKLLKSKLDFEAKTHAKTLELLDKAEEEITHNEKIISELEWDLFAYTGH
jgi:hypothetical protein